MSCAKTAEPIEMPYETRQDPRKHVLDGGSHWRHLANITETSTWSGNVAYLSNLYIKCGKVSVRTYVRNAGHGQLSSE